MKENNFEHEYEKHIKMKLHIKYISLISLILCSLAIISAGYNNEAFINQVSFAGTISSIILSVIAIIMTINSETKTENVKDNLLKISSDLANITETYKKVSQDNEKASQSITEASKDIRNSSIDLRNVSSIRKEILSLKEIVEKSDKKIDKLSEESYEKQAKEFREDLKNIDEFDDEHVKIDNKFNTSIKFEKIKRGEIYLATNDKESSYRPVIIVQNNIGNKYSPTVVVISVTTLISEKKLPTHIFINSNKYNIGKDGIALAEQIKTLDKRRLIEKIGMLSNEEIFYLDKAISIELGLN